MNLLTKLDLATPSGWGLNAGVRPMSSNAEFYKMTISMFFISICFGERETGFIASGSQRPNCLEFSCRTPRE